MKQFFYVLFINLLCLDLAFGQSARELARQFTSFQRPGISLTDLNKRIDQFGERMWGYEIESPCEESEIADEKESNTCSPVLNESGHRSFYYIPASCNDKEDHLSFIYDFHQNACRYFLENRTSLDDEKVNTQLQKDCIATRVPGEVDNIISETLRLDASKESRPPLEVSNELLRELYQEALYIQEQLMIYLYAPNLYFQDRQDLLVNYLENVVLGMREIVVLLRSYRTHRHETHQSYFPFTPRVTTPHIDPQEAEYDGNYFYESLLVRFPHELLGPTRSGIPFEHLLSIGRDVVNKPFSFLYRDLGARGLELVFDEFSAKTHDITTLLKAPSSDNYIRAAKWMTLNLMIQQYSIYSAMTSQGGGNEMDQLSIPRSCQTLPNANLPPFLDFSGSAQETGTLLIDQILENQGLLPSNDNMELSDLYRQYYVDDNYRDPTVNGFLGIIPFEKHTAARHALSRTGRTGGATGAGIDDISYYNELLSLRLPRAQGHYLHHQHVKTRLFRRAEKRTYLYNDLELLDGIINTPNDDLYYQVVDSEGEVSYFSPSVQNISEFIANYMQRNGISVVNDVLTDDQKQDLKNQKIEIRFPKLYGSVVWRNWALNRMNEYLQEALALGDLPGGVIRGIRATCNNNHALYQDYNRQAYNGIREDETSFYRNCVYLNRREMTNEAFVESIVDEINDFLIRGQFIPYRDVHPNQLFPNYNFLAGFWNELNKTKDLPYYDIDEYTFLFDQLAAGNPWARMRLGYLVASRDLQSIRGGFTPVMHSHDIYDTPRMDLNSSCFLGHIGGQIRRFDGAAKELGLDKPLTPHGRDSLLSRRERDYFWESVQSSANENSHSLFNVKISRGNKTAYDLIEEVAYTNTINRQSVEELIAQNNFSLYSSDREDLDAYLGSPQYQIGEKLFSLYKLRDSEDDQIALMAEIMEEHPEFHPDQAKGMLITNNIALKTPLYRSIIRNAAIERKHQIQDQIDELCQHDIYDFESYRALFYSTLKAQNQLNSMLGVAEVPETVMKRLQGFMFGMGHREVKVVVHSLLSVGLLLGAILLGKACTAVSFGACLPLAVGMVAAAYGGLRQQFLALQTEVTIKQDADHYVRLLSMMEDLGFTDQNSSYHVSRSIFWSIMEGFFVLPFFNIGVRGLTTGSRILSKGAISLGTATSNAQRMAIIRGREVAISEDLFTKIIFSRHILRLDNLRSSVNSIGSAAADSAKILQDGTIESMSSYQNLLQQYRRGQITRVEFYRRYGEIISPLMKRTGQSVDGFYRQVANATINESVERINQQTANVVVNYYKGKPQELLRYIESMSGSRLDKAISFQEKLNSGASGISRFRWIRNLRTRDLAAQESNLRSIRSKLLSVGNNAADFERFIIENIDVLTDIFMHMPTRVREFPYYILFLGFPRVLGNKVPVVGQISEGIYLSQVFNSRAFLVHESLKYEARRVLGIAPEILSDKVSVSYQAFRTTSLEKIGHLYSSGNTQEAIGMTRVLVGMEDQLFPIIKESWVRHLERPNSVMRFLQRSGRDLDDSTLRRIIFDPSNARERALSESIWKVTPIDRILATDKMGSLAHEVVLKLSNYSNLSDFERFLNALKVLTVKRKELAHVLYF